MRTDRPGLTAAGLLTFATALAAGPARWPLLAVAFALGWVFVATGFGFTGGFRAWQRDRDGGRLAASLLVPAVAALAIIPVAALVPGYGGALAPPTAGLVAGAALFGLGMQLANGCGSGCVVAAGAGSRRMWVALPAFCLGGVLGSLLLPLAERLPGPAPLVLTAVVGPWAALAATLLAIVGLAGWVLRRGGRPPAGELRAAALTGGLAALLFLVSGSPWGITMGLTLAGAQAAQATGLPIGAAPFWQEPGMAAALAGRLLDHDSALADIGLLLGAAGAAATRGRLRGQAWPDRRSISAAVLGGLCMGVGARLAYGCNIGAFVGGIASGSLHGWLWFAAVLPGSWLGIRLRPAFGLERG